MGNEGFMKYFTKEKCYPNQHEAMTEIEKTLGAGGGILFEGACGTGKTLSALAPALSVAAGKKQTVIIVTNVHQQMVQFINEAREIYKKTPINVIVLKGKQAMCPENKDYEECRALCENSYELVKAENEMTKLVASIREATQKFNDTKDPEWREEAEHLEKDLRAIEESVRKIKDVSCSELYEIIKFDSPAFRTWLFDDVRSPEDVNEYAEEHGMCGYELLKKELKRADLIICNYHHVLDPEIFTMILGRMERTPEDIILIFDEAHNIENAARSHSSITITEHVIDHAIVEMEENASRIPETLREDGERIFAAFYDTIRETYNFKLGPAGKARIGYNWTDLRISDPIERFDIVRERFLKKIDELKTKTKRPYTPENVRKIMVSVSEIGRMIENGYYENFKNGNGPLRKSYISRSADFISAYLILASNPNYYPILNVRRDRMRDNGDIYGRMELFACIPRDVTRELFNVVGGFVLMSATLRPFDMIKETLGIERDCTEIAFGTTFPEERRKTFAVSVPPLFSNRRDDMAVSNAVEMSLISAIKETPGNVLIYFQSSTESEKYTRFLKTAFGDSIPIFTDVTGTSANDIREQFFRIGEAGGKAVLVSYILGTLSEGVDFRHGRARTVIIVGVGYPALNDRARAVETAYDTVFGEGTGWEFSILVPTIRRVPLPDGRVVRSPTDYGVRVLLDARYQVSSAHSLGKYSVVDSFPYEEKKEIIDIRPLDLGKAIAEFFEKFKDEENEFRKCSPKNSAAYLAEDYGKYKGPETDRENLKEEAEKEDAAYEKAVAAFEKTYGGTEKTKNSDTSEKTKNSDDSDKTKKSDTSEETDSIKMNMEKTDSKNTDEISVEEAPSIPTVVRLGRKRKKSEQ